MHVSEWMAAQFRRTSALESPLAVVLSGAGDVDTPQVARDETKRLRRPYLLAVSNLYDYKRMDVVLQAYASRRQLHQCYDLVIGGAEIHSGVLDGLRRQVRTLGLAEEQVRLLGFVTGDELAQLYHSASLYVSASEREAFPLTPAEALVAGLPVALTDIPPFRELYAEWATLAPVGKADDLATAMVTAVQKGPRPGQSEAVRQRFSWDRNAHELAALLVDASASRRPRLRDVLARIRRRQIPTLLRTLAGRNPQQRID
jgi:glycosyltransferase involved in cell wall biosynthesis